MKYDYGNIFVHYGELFNTCVIWNMALRKEWDTEQWKLKTLITELPTNSIDQQHRKEALSSRAHAGSF
jgi:hypothetical protein